MCPDFIRQRSIILNILMFGKFETEFLYIWSLQTVLYYCVEIIKILNGNITNAFEIQMS